MAHLNLDLRTGASPLFRYGFAVVSVAVALGLALVVQNYEFRDVGVPLFVLAIALVTWHAGIGPSVLSVALSTVAFDYFFIEPLYSFYVSAKDLPYFFTFVIWAVIVGGFAAIRRRIETDLLQTRDRLEIEVQQRTQHARLLDQTHDSIMVRDMNSVITYWNRGAEELYGWRPEEAIGKESFELLKTVFPKPRDELHEELIRNGRWEGELERVKADGTGIIVACRWALQRDALNQPLSILETNNDITARKHREEEITRLNHALEERADELQVANKELESFAYSVSHDLRAPLRHVVGYGELLQKHAASSLDDKSRRYMQTIIEAAKRMGNLIDDLLSFSRIGRAETKKTSVDLTQLVSEVIAELGQETKGRDIVWKIGDLPTCLGDRSMLKLVFMNLISNAVKFTRPRSPAEIEIGCADGPGGTEVFVRDNGAGFDMRYVDKLFGVFQRLHLAEEFEGTGIGLATVQRIIHRHGGRVRAEGVLDQGAKFSFSLPGH
ncbi:MAG TPA: ATP-binding protein [Xanthobacteraceae bacterium]|nr:ATP-binding protein [Xanthobacteraceae bacterium]